MSVTEMARTVGLSRQRFHQLIGTTFPRPVYDVCTRRPLYTAEQQAVCIEVRRRNCGIDGRPVMFYAARGGASALARKQSKRGPAKPKASATDGPIVEGVRALGHTRASAAQVEHAVGELFPAGTADVAQGEVIRRVFVQLMRRDSGDNAGR